MKILHPSENTLSPNFMALPTYRLSPGGMDYRLGFWNILTLSGWLYPSVRTWFHLSWRWISLTTDQYWCSDSSYIYCQLFDCDQIPGTWLQFSIIDDSWTLITGHLPSVKCYWGEQKFVPYHLYLKYQKTSSVYIKSTSIVIEASFSFSLSAREPMIGWFTKPFLSQLPYIFAY